MQLQVLDLERIPTTMFRKPTPEIRHGIDKLVCDLQEQLHAMSVNIRTRGEWHDVRPRPRDRSARWGRRS